MGLWLLMTAPTSATGGLVASAAIMGDTTMGDTISSAMASALDISAAVILLVDSTQADSTAVADIDKLT
jgi:hypothetical protein